MTAAEHKSDFSVRTDTPYLTITAELWDVFYENSKKIDHVTTPYVTTPGAPFTDMV